MELDDDAPEIWREVPHMGGQFIASSRGRVAKITGHASGAGYVSVTVPSRVLLNAEVGFGTPNNSKSGHRMYAHHMVALAFHGDPPEGKTQINHKDTNKSNNRPNNIEWSDQCDNMQHAWDAGERKTILRKYTEEQYREVRRLYAAGGVTYGQIAKQLGLTWGGVKHIIADSRRFR